jgi:two-component system heavy metal sensor histidine kinase CusS
VSSRLALLFAACTAVVSLFAGVLFSRASEAHFVELDQQLLDSKLIGLRRPCRSRGLSVKRGWPMS